MVAPRFNAMRWGISVDGLARADGEPRRFGAFDTPMVAHGSEDSPQERIPEPMQSRLASFVCRKARIYRQLASL